jgi:hypothetical protein
VGFVILGSSCFHVFVVGARDAGVVVVVCNAVPRVSRNRFLGFFENNDVGFVILRCWFLVLRITTWVSLFSGVAVFLFLSVSAHVMQASSSSFATRSLG